jgi:hypothetical protein
MRASSPRFQCNMAYQMFTHSQNSPQLKKNQGIKFFRHPPGVTDQINKQSTSWALAFRVFWVATPKTIVNRMRNGGFRG